MFFNKPYSPLIALLIAASTILFYFYGPIITAPNSYLFNDSGDGLKNYFTYAYHIKHDSTMVHFEGMNYPFGEIITYTDGHPLLSTIVKVLSSHYPSIQHYSIGILNSTMLLGLFSAFFALYYLLIELEVNMWRSVIFSIGITLLAPQVFRFTGHYSLSYIVAIPLSWLFLVKTIKSFHYKHILMLLANGMFWVAMHAYFGVMIAGFSLLVVIAEIIFDRKSLLRMLFVSTAIVIPVLLYLGFTNEIDTHLNRTNNPVGFNLYNAEIDDILVPPEKPLYPIIDYVTKGKVKLKWEARGYLGLFNVLFLAGLFIITILAVKREQSRNLLTSFFTTKKLNSALLASLILLVFALGFPFKAFPELLDVFGVMKQFRTTGRFVWPFYFVFSIFTAYVIDYLIRRKNQNWLSALIMSSYVIMAFTEGYFYQKSVSSDITNHGNLFNQEHHYLKQLDTGNYQAIITFPFYHTGSENLSLESDQHTLMRSMLTSYSTGLPLMCSSLSRTSITESRSLVQLIGPAYYDKPIKSKLDLDKPILGLRIKDNAISYEENMFLNQSKMVFESDSFQLFEIDPHIFFQYNSSDLKSRFHKAFLQSEHHVSDTNAFFYYETFEHHLTDTNRSGNGCLRVKKAGEQIIKSFKVNHDQEAPMSLSLWFYNGLEGGLNDWLRLQLIETDAHGREINTTTVFPDHARILDGMWSFVEIEFIPQNRNNQFVLKSIGKKHNKQWLYIDDIMIRAQGLDVFRKDQNNSTFYWNNHIVSIAD